MKELVLSNMMYHGFKSQNKLPNIHISNILLFDYSINANIMQKKRAEKNKRTCQNKLILYKN